MYLRLLTSLLTIFIPACESSSTAFHMMYSAYKLNKQRNNIQPCRTPYPILNQYIVSCLVHIKLQKAVIHVIILVSFLCYGFHSGGCGIIVLASFACPLMDEDKRIVQAS